jgi:hypothetical protein
MMNMPNNGMLQIVLLLLPANFAGFFCQIVASSLSRFGPVAMRKGDEEELATRPISFEVSVNFAEHPIHFLVETIRFKDDVKKI